MSTNIKLNNISIDALTEIAEQLQDAVGAILNSTGCNDLPVDISDQCKRLLCRSQEWRSKAFFVIVVGPVKSGKSTFVNLLAHEKVSPTHFLECTVRPSIISRKSDESKDSLITSFLTEGDPSIEHVDTIIDYIKGLPYADLSNVKKEEPCVLTDVNLDKIHSALDLTGRSKIALTAITARGGIFLQDDIYMIDMPGFDGVMANLNASFYKAIVDRADLVVFVQSSNSAINKISEDFCKMILERNDSVPIYFVHNYFDSAYWHTKEERDRVTKGHIDKAMEFFQEHKFTVNSEDTFRVNLGKVTDARDSSFMGDSTKFLSEYRDALMKEEECFVTLERKLHEKISSSQNKMRLLNCINRTIRETKILEEILSKRKDILTSTKEEYNRINGLFADLISATKLIESNAIFNISDTFPQLITLLADIRQQYCNKSIGHEQKYNTDITREKARELIRGYRKTTESFVNNVFNPKAIQSSVPLKYNTSFIQNIPDELKKFNILYQNVCTEDESIEINYLPINDVYDVEKNIPRLVFRTRKGSEVIGHMTDIENALFGLSTENPCGYIPLHFFGNLKKEIEEWLGNISHKCWQATINKIEKAKTKALLEIIPDLTSHEKEMKQIECLLEGISEITNKIKMR